jgi:hypothetical protein
MEANGEPQTIAFRTFIQRSSWVALRIFPTCHSNPVYLQVAQRKIRVSRQSADWCVQCINAAWRHLGGRIARRDQQDAELAKKHAVATFELIKRECET